MDYFETVQRWHELKATIQHLQAEERALREGLFSGTFPNPEEGVNKYTLPDGSVLKGTYKLNRTLDDDKLKELVKEGLLPKKVYRAIRRVKVELNLAEYRKLSDKHAKICAEAITVKPGLPSLEYIPAINEDE